MKEKKDKIEKESVILFVLALVKLIIHLSVNAFAGYGIFRDEFYYLACSHRLALGYVDQPPFSILMLALNRTLFGDSLFALRLLPALVGALTVLFTGLIVRKLGGRTTAVVVACLAAISAPIMLGMNSYYSMNSFDIFSWTLAAYFLVRLIKENNPKFWLALGVVIGLGLLNKISMGFFACGLVIAVLFTGLRKYLATKWPYLAGLLALALFLPYIAWNLTHDFAHLEFIRNATRWKYSSVTPLDFILGQFLSLNPLTLPVWLAGLYYYFFNKPAAQAAAKGAATLPGKDRKNNSPGSPQVAAGSWLPLGIVYAVVFIIFIVNGHSKAEYLSPIYPMLFAAGGAQIEKLTQQRYLKWLKFVLPTAIVISGLLLAPLALPCLPVTTYIGYTKAIGFSPESSEAKELAELPQHYADMFGWENMAKTVAKVYAALPEEEKSRTVIYARNYGQAGAIEYYSRKYELPPVISSHNNYWFWGQAHIRKDYRTVIIIGGRLEDHLDSLEQVEKADVIRCRYCMPYENNLTVFIGRKLKRSLIQIWQSDKIFI